LGKDQITRKKRTRKEGKFDKGGRGKNKFHNRPPTARRGFNPKPYTRGGPRTTQWGGGWGGGQKNLTRKTTKKKVPGEVTIPDRKTNKGGKKKPIMEETKGKT